MDADDQAHPYAGLAGHLRELRSHPEALRRWSAYWAEIPSEAVQNLTVERRQHLLHSAAALARAFKTNASSRSPASEDGPVGPGLELPLVVPSLVAFRPGDVAERCPMVIESAKRMGARWMTVFYPLPYSGGNRATVPMVAHPQHGKDWRIERVGQPTYDETSRCVRAAWKAGLGLHWVPHLESVRLLHDPSSQGEWRLLSGIPLDEHYFEAAFSPLKRLLKSHPREARRHGLRVSLAAEVDPMVFAAADVLLAQTGHLRQELEAMGVRAELVWNPNGDFHHGRELPQAASGARCDALHAWITRLHRLAPSIYAENGHVSMHEGRPDMAKTRRDFLSRLHGRLSELCPQQDWPKATAGLRFSFGEFALDHGQQAAYPAVWKQLGEVSGVDDVTLWSEGRWDHAGVITRAPASD